MQLAFFNSYDQESIQAPAGQLLKWIGNKQRFAAEIVSFFPQRFGVYYEPFLGSGAVLATLAPKQAVGSDSFPVLVEIWQTLVSAPSLLKVWYAERWQEMAAIGKGEAYERIKARYNGKPNAADLLFLCRACYGGVVRFRKADGYMSTPCGIHDPISPVAFNKRVDEWHRRVRHTQIKLADYQEVMREASAGDLVYCDPPYAYSQTILYGAQAFNLADLFGAIADCKKRGVFVALSIDGTKRSGDLFCDIEVPEDLFDREVMIRCGRSMLRRFQLSGRTLETEEVFDRLLLTY
ncbi:MAG: DNA adenine methylase [Verrucomicrobiota bacterium]|nr:DNA adenine methylase [Verrucomicrobiota bacterium]